MLASPPELVLASASPRRSDLLSQAGIAFEVIPSNIPEERKADERPRAFALRLAREKALAVADQLPEAPTRWILGADTIVVLGEQVLGKPRDAEHAYELLDRLQGRRHEVVTAVALTQTANRVVADTAVASQVWLRTASEAELRAYVSTGEPLDKAGAYALQGEGQRFVERVEGSRTNVIGLPVEETLALLERMKKSTDSP